MFGLSLIKDEELKRLQKIEEHAKGLVSELENPVPCHVMKGIHKKNIINLCKTRTQ